MEAQKDRDCLILNPKISALENMILIAKVTQILQLDIKTLENIKDMDLNQIIYRLLQDLKIRLQLKELIHLNRNLVKKL